MKATFRKAPAPYNYVEMVFLSGKGPRAHIATFCMEEGHNIAHLDYEARKKHHARLKNQIKNNVPLQYREEA